MRNYPRVYTSFMPNAPTLSGVPGNWLDIMKKCLTGGWTPFDISSIAVSGGVGTINFNQLNKSLPDYCYLTITGCSEPLLNIEVCIEKGFVTMGEFKTTVADGTYGGTIKATPSPAGWELMFTGANTAIMRSGNIDSSRMVVRIDDTRAQNVAFDFGSDALGIDQLVDPPYINSFNERNFFKAYNASASSFRNWAIVCDNTTVYFSADSHTTQYTAAGLLRENFIGGRWYGFGDYIPNNSFDSTPSFYFMSDSALTATSQSINIIALPYYSVSFDNSPSYIRTGVRSSTFIDKVWETAFFSNIYSLASNIARISGTASRLDATDYETIYSDVSLPPVCASLVSSSITMFGSIPGMRFSHYFLVPFKTFFKADTDTKTDTTYLHLPVSNYNRGNDLYEQTMGVILFTMGKKWGN